MGALVLCNGVSSSGKSTLAAGLQERLPGVWLHLALDQLHACLPPRFLDPEARLSPEDALVAVDLLPRLQDELARLATALVLGSSQVIVDVVLARGAHDLHPWRRALSTVPSVLIAVRARPEIVRARELRRGDRRPGTADLQWDRVHRHLDYDLAVDTSAGLDPGMLTDLASQVKSLLTPPTRGGTPTNTPEGTAL